MHGTNVKKKNYITIKRELFKLGGYFYCSM